MIFLVKALTPLGAILFGVREGALAFCGGAIIPRIDAILTTTPASRTRSAIFLPHTQHLTSTRLFETKYDKDGNVKKNLLQHIQDPYPSRIPNEIKNEIYDAEGKTEAAKGRGQRIFLYVASILFFSALAFQNAVFNEFRVASEAKGEPFTIDASLLMGYDNFLTRFFFTTGIGAFISVAIMVFSIFSVDGELNSRHDNAEKIYEELLRRRKNNKRRKKSSPSPSDVGSLHQGRKKRTAALGELLQDEEQPTVSAMFPTEEQQETELAEPPPFKIDEKSKTDGIIGKLKGWYEQADNMAASQALLLNKELEDRGIVDKITDESGLKVIGKDAAERLQEKKNQESESV